MKKVLSLLLLTALIMVFAVPALAAGSKTDPVEIVETLHDGEHQDWTESTPSVVPTPEEASEVTGIPEEQVSILWTVDYDTDEYPVEIVINAPGTEDLPIYVLEYIDDEWVVIGTGTGPDIKVPVEVGGLISVVTEIPVLYEVTEGMGGVWYRESNVNLPFTCERNIDDPVAYDHWLQPDGIKVDDVVIAPSNYSAVSGSVKLELYPAYLSTLELGEHKLTFCFDDGNREASTNFFVKEGSGSGTPEKDQTQTAPKTGDATWLIATAVITVVAIGGALMLTRRREQ